jgi:hypothetical protein
MDRYIKEGWSEHDQRNRGIPKIHWDHGGSGPWFSIVRRRAFDAGEDIWWLAIRLSHQQRPFSPAEQRLFSLFGRTVLSYFQDPLLRGLDESIREP